MSKTILQMTRILGVRGETPSRKIENILSSTCKVRHELNNSITPVDMHSLLHTQVLKRAATTAVCELLQQTRFFRS
jgi:hypothetical protein